MTDAAPDKTEAARFLSLLDPTATRFTFQTFDDDKERKNGKLAKIFHGTIDEHFATLARLNSQGAGVYVTVNATDFLGRKIPNIVKVRSLFVDLDGSPLDRVMSNNPLPHLVTETSPGRWHTYWWVSDAELSDFTRYQKALAAQFGGDTTVHDLPRVMRLAGFLHRKGRPTMVRIIKVNAAPPFSVASFTVPDEVDAEAIPDHLTSADDAYSGDTPSPWAVLNTLALANLDKWVPELFGAAAKHQAGTNGYRVSSKMLGREREEDLSFHSSGIKDWGVHDIGDERQGRRSPIDVVMEFRQVDNLGAFRWLDSRLRGTEEEDTVDLSEASAGETEVKSETKKEEKQQEQPSDLHIVRAYDVVAKLYNWLWKSRIARGKVTLIVGMPDTNKSTLTLDLTSRITKGDVLPNNEGRAPLGNVIILSAEDDVADTIRPRLEVAGADLTRVHVITAVKLKKNGRRTFDLTQDIERLERAVRNIGDVVMIVIDPYSAYMGKPGKLDSFRSTDVRATLAPLFDMAGRLEVAVVAIGHLNKSGSMPALMRVLDSVAFVAASRGVYLVARDPEDEDRRLFLPAKNNIGKIRTGLAFKIYEKLATTVFDCYPAVRWEDGDVTMTADEALSWREDGRRSEAAEKAKTLLMQLLANGSMKQQEVQAKAAEQQISPRSLRTAKVAVGVVSTRADGAWWWTLPGHTPTM